MTRIETLIRELQDPATCTQASYAARHLIACAEIDARERERLQGAIDQMPEPVDAPESIGRFW